MTTTMYNSQPGNTEFWIDYARAMAGALIFSFPLLMTMEMWWLGMYMDRFRLALFITVLLPTLFGLSRYSGFRETMGWYDDIIDGLVAFSAGVLTSAIFLSLFGVLGLHMSFNDIVGKIAILAVPASMGAIIAGKQLGETENERERRRAGYPAELFVMMAGALFLAFNVAPTEEIILIAQLMTTWHTVLLVLLSLLIMHAFVYSVGFIGQHKGPEGATFWRLVYHFTIVGYVLALLVSAYVLWTFGRFEGLSPAEIVMTTAVLGFPAAFGAALARLVI